jgi:amino acid adenylation domain-containing protein
MSNDVLTQVIEHARRDPRRLAVSDLDRSLTYGELVDEAARVATGLSRRGVEVGDRVALFLGNSVDFVVAALSCLWSGAIFVPLATTDPPGRIETVIQDCDPKLIIDTATNDIALSGHELTHLNSLVANERADEPIALVARPVYAIYTSGTTGTPKGVLIGSRALAAAVDASVSALELSSNTRSLAVSPFHFDGSYGTLFPTLSAGGALVIRPRDSLLFPRTFFNAVRDESITHTGFSPSYLKILLASPQLKSLADTTLEVLALGGESSSASDLRALWDVAPSIRIFNRYGPTETTIAVTHREVTRDMVDVGPITMGRPHEGVIFVLIDDRGERIEAANVVGELYIGGVQLMERYWGAPLLTDVVLREDVVPGELLYRTGDLVYMDDARDYVYVDRSDRVVKRSGVRISLVEMSEAMAGLEGVNGAACVVYDDDGEVGIAAFVLCDDGVDILALQRAARAVLPDTMLANVVVPVKDLPLASTGKLNERELLSTAGLRARVRHGAPAKN